jgi:uncharacterized membrane protein YraQ (UPF0718 family)
MWEILRGVAEAWWHILNDSAFYVLLGIAIAGLLKVALNANTVLNQLGRGRFSSVVKAAALGVPLPL